MAAVLPTGGAPVSAAPQEVSAEEVAALQEEFARLVSQQALELSQTQKEVEALESQLSATRKREANATNDCAARVADITTVLVSKELSQLDERYVPVDGTAALADTYGTLQTEHASLREEEAQRNVRSACCMLRRWRPARGAGGPRSRADPLVLGFT